jgi:hypothetical protein
LTISTSIRRSSSHNSNDAVSNWNVNGTEVVGREYKFHHLKLPHLVGSQNYYCGIYRNCFWHQNADQVLIHCPLNPVAKTKDIRATFEVFNVSLRVNDIPLVSFICPERIIPHGSFWTIENDIDGEPYIQIDLEKRYRMLNWKSLFGELNNSSSVTDNNQRETHLDEKKSKVLQRLLDANKGLSKITGLPPETISDIMNNEDVLNEIIRDPRPVRGLSADDEMTMSAPTREESIINLLENKGIKESLEKLTSSEGFPDRENDAIDSSWKEV